MGQAQPTRKLLTLTAPASRIARPRRNANLARPTFRSKARQAAPASKINKIKRQARLLHGALSPGKANAFGVSIVHRDGKIAPAPDNSDQRDIVLALIA